VSAAPIAGAARTAKRAGAALAVLWLAGCAAGTETGVGRTIISAAESKLVFYGADPTTMRAIHFRLDPPGRNATGYLGVWRGTGDAFPQARISYYELAPGYHFRADHDIEGYVGRLGFGDAGEIEVGDGGRLRNGLGPIDYLRFAVGPVACVAFGQSWGRASSDSDPTASTNRLIGHYCGAEDEKLPYERIAEIVAAIGVRGQYLPEPPTDAARAADKGPIELPFRADWTGYHESLSGAFLAMGSGGRGRIYVPLPGGAGDCLGEWRRQSGGGGTGAPQRGTWKLLCTNGRSAEGTYAGPSPFEGSGMGVDADGNRVTFTYGRAIYAPPPEGAGQAPTR